MADSGPGMSFREGLSLAQLFDLFPDDASAEAWFIACRWPDGVRCPHCGCGDVLDGAKHRSQRYRCRGVGCRKRFSVRAKTVLASSNAGLHKWVILLYVMVTNLKGVSSVKLGRDLGVTQKTAWFMAHRVREAMDNSSDDPFLGPVESDETYIGGKAKNMHREHREEVISGRGTSGKIPVVGIKDRAANQVRASPVDSVDSDTLTSEITAAVAAGAVVHTDGSGAYGKLAELGYEHESVAHSVGEYVRGAVHTNGIESFWAMLKRGYIGVYHKMSAKHLHRYVDEFSGRVNIRFLGTLEQMRQIAVGMIGKRLLYADLVA